MKRFAQAVMNFWQQYQNARDVDFYLAKSTDHADLERRIKHLQRIGKL